MKEKKGKFSTDIVSLSWFWKCGLLLILVHHLQSSPGFWFQQYPHISKSFVNGGCYCIKLGQNIFSNDEEPFISWLDSLTENALYKVNFMRILR